MRKIGEETGEEREDVRDTIWEKAKKTDEEKGRIDISV